MIHYGLIVDGIHTHSAAVRLAHRVHPQGLVLVTDAVPALGLPDGNYHMGADQIVVEKKRATIAGTQTLCGSIASMAECVQNMRQALLDGELNRADKATKTSSDAIDKHKFIVESIEAATLHPASGRTRPTLSVVHVFSSSVQCFTSNGRRVRSDSVPMPTSSCSTRNSMSYPLSSLANRRGPSMTTGLSMLCVSALANEVHAFTVHIPSVI